jgi:hypothetical protein
LVPAAIDGSDVAGCVELRYLFFDQIPDWRRDSGGVGLRCGRDDCVHLLRGEVQRMLGAHPLQEAQRVGHTHILDWCGSRISGRAIRLDGRLRDAVRWAVCCWDAVSLVVRYGLCLAELRLDVTCLWLAPDCCLWLRCIWRRADDRNGCSRYWLYSRGDLRWGRLREQRLLPCR